MIKNKEENVIELCYVYESGLRNRKKYKTNDRLIEDSLDNFFKRLENARKKTFLIEENILELNELFNHL